MDQREAFRGLTREFNEGRLSRRSFLRATTLVGFSGAAAAFLAACGTTPAATTAPTAAPTAATSAGASAAPSAAPATAVATAVSGQKDIINMRSGSGVVTGHPFIAMVDDYNRTHPNVEVKLEMYPWANDTAPLATTIAAGGPPDVTRQSIPGVAGAAALQSPLLLDIRPYLTPEEIADYGSDILGPPDIGGKIVLWPQDRDWGTMVVANGTMLEAAGIDVAKIHKDGWTFDEFRETAKKLTKGGVYGFGFSGDNAGGIMLELPWRAGVPDGNANMGAYFWGNKFDLTGTNEVKALQLLHDMIYVDKSVPSEVTGLKEHMPLLWGGKVAMINYWHGAVGELKAYNAAIDSGQVKGTKANFNVVLLPWPYSAPGANVNIARTTGLAVFKQDPYKGDAHTQNVVDFVRFLTTPINLAVFSNWEGTIPAKTSAYPYSTQVSDPQIGWWVPYAKSHSIATFPYGHDAFGPIFTDAMNAEITAVLNNEKSAQQAVDTWTPAASAIMDKWVKDNPDIAAKWTTPPAGWPDSMFKPTGG